MLSFAIAAAAVTSAMTIPGPKGDIAGTFVNAGKGAPVVLIIPGSGPTDRDGNNPIGVKAAPYKLLADALAEKGVSTLRADKRGMFESKAAIEDANSVTIADYAGDAHAWADALKKRTRCQMRLAIGSQRRRPHCARSRSAAGWAVRRDSRFGGRPEARSRHSRAAERQPCQCAVVPPAMAALDSLEAGKTVDQSTLPAPLLPLFTRRFSRS